jgi:hypothetical protein
MSPKAETAYVVGCGFAAGSLVTLGFVFLVLQPFAQASAVAALSFLGAITIELDSIVRGRVKVADLDPEGGILR